MTIELKSLGPNRLGWFTVTYQTASPTQWCTLLWPGVGLKGETCRATERNGHHGQLTRCFFELPDSNLNDKDWQVTRKSDTSQHSFDPENSKYEFLRVTAVTITNTKDMCWTGVQCQPKLIIFIVIIYRSRKLGYRDISLLFLYSVIRIKGQWPYRPAAIRAMRILYELY